MKTTETKTEINDIMSTLTDVPILNEVSIGDDEIPATKHSSQAFVIHNSGYNPVGVDTSSERGDTSMYIPPNSYMVLDARVEGFYVDGPAHVSLGKLSPRDIDELDRLEAEDQEEEFVEYGFRRPGHPCYVRQVDVNDETELIRDETNIIPVYFSRHSMLSGETPIGNVNKGSDENASAKIMLEAEAVISCDNSKPPLELTKIEKVDNAIIGVWNK